MLQDVPAGLRWQFALGSLVAMGAIAFDSYLSASFGWTISFSAAFIMGLISVASGVLMVIAGFFWCRGWKPLAYGVAVVWCFAFLFNCWSNMGVASGDRMTNIQKAQWQETKADEAIKGKDELAGQIKFFQKRRAELEADMRKLVETTVNGWKVAAAPESTAALDKLIAEKAAEQEREQGRGGCGPKCEARAAEKRHLILLRGIAAKIESNNQQLAAAESGLKKARAGLASVSKVKGSTANQSTVHASLMNFTLSPQNVTQEQIEESNMATGVALAFVLALVSAGMTFASAWPHLVETYSHEPNRERPNAAGITHSAHTVPHAEAKAAPVPSNLDSVLAAARSKVENLRGVTVGAVRYA